jgi:methylthioribose-1-phosphate isomerase
MKSLEWFTPLQSGVHNKLRFIDQTKLPIEENYIETNDYEVVADAIRRLSIRGAPALGVAVAYGVSLAAFKNKETDSTTFQNYISSAIELLKSTRPTAVNLFWSLERMKKVLEINIQQGVEHTIIKLEQEAIKIHDEDIQMCEAIGRNGAELIPNIATILTHCNTGALATGGNGTAQNVIATAHKQGKKIKVFVDETRPLLQGARLTTWELMNLGIDITLITDNMAAFLMQQKKIDIVITGADRITSSGYVANKVGTYNVAVAANYHGIPLYVAAPTSTIDLKLQAGSEIVIEERDPSEVTEGFGKRIAPYGIYVYSPSFDITPPNLINAIITDKAVIYPPYEESLRTSLHLIANTQ